MRTFKLVLVGVAVLLCIIALPLTAAGGAKELYRKRNTYSNSIMS